MARNARLVRTTRTTVRTAILVAMLSAGSTALAATEFIAMTKMTDSQRSSVSKSGVALIETVADTRSEIAQKDYMRAQRELRKALQICHQIVDASPSLSLQNSFEAALDSLDHKKKKYPEQLAPIYHQLDVYKTVTDDAAIRTQVASAQRKLEAGQVEAGMADLREASTKIAYFEVDLPINETYQLLGLTSDDFARGDYLAADSKLRKIQASLKSFATAAKIDVDDEEFAEAME